MTEMSGAFRYAVVRVGPEWRVVGARRAMGHFATRDLALTAAGNLAREAFLRPSGGGAASVRER